VAAAYTTMTGAGSLAGCARPAAGGRAGLVAS